MERDQIIKALECFHQRILDTDLAKNIYEAEIMAIIDALSLIDELTEENDRLSTALAEYEHKTNIRISEEYVHNEAYEELREECEKWKSRIPIECEYTKADTVKKMRESVKNRLTETYGDLPHTNCFINAVDQIAKEMLEGEDERE